MNFYRMHYKNGTYIDLPSNTDGIKFFRYKYTYDDADDYGVNDYGVGYLAMYKGKIFCAYSVRFRNNYINLYETNDVDNVLIMSGCINLDDTIFEIIYEEDDIIYVRKLDLA